MTEHCRGYVEAMMRLRPPVFASEEYNRGYMCGFSDRLAAVKDALIPLQEKGQ